MAITHIVVGITLKYEFVKFDGQSFQHLNWTPGVYMYLYCWVCLLLGSHWMAVPNVSLLFHLIMPLDRFQEAGDVGTGVFAFLAFVCGTCS